MPISLLLFAWVSLGSHSLPLLDIDHARDPPPEALGGLGDEKLSVGLAYTLASLSKYSVRLLFSVEYVEEGETAIDAFSIATVGLSVFSGILGVSTPR